MLTDIISPEIYNDEFYHSLKTIIEYFNIKNILEIGASSGQGSTQCFLQSKNNECKLFSIEISKERFTVLSNNNYQNFYPYLGSSIDIEGYMTDDEVKNFYNNKKTNTTQSTAVSNCICQSHCSSEHALGTRVASTFST